MPLFGPNISKMKDQADAEGLIKELKNKSQKVRIDAARALKELKHARGLIQAVANDDSEVRLEAVVALADCDERAAIDALAELLTKDRAELVWQKTFEIMSKSTKVDEATWTRIGMGLLNDRRYENALSCFRRAIDIKPDKSSICSIGAALMDCQRHQDALEYFEKFIAIDPNDARGWAGKGLALFNLDRDREAIDFCEKALAIDPGLLSPARTLGAIYLRRRDYGTLASFAENRIRIAPEDINSRLLLSEALAASSKLAEAESELHKALEFLYKKEYLKSDDLSAVYKQLGIVFAMRGHKDKVREAFEKSIDAKPTDAEAKQLLEAYDILYLFAVAMRGSPTERRDRLVNLVVKRLEAQNGKGLSQSEKTLIAIWKDESLPDLMREWYDDTWLSSFFQVAILKLWPAEYLAQAVKIMPQRALEACQKHLEGTRRE